jgi:hypothetical protein
MDESQPGRSGALPVRGEGQPLGAAGRRVSVLSVGALTVAVALIAVCLRLWQYASGTSMWIDEL